MRVKIREILDDCIADGLRSGYTQAYKYEDFPCEETVIGYMDDHIWLEIDRKFDFEPDEDYYPRGVCTEVVEGFDRLDKEREWVGLEGDWVAGQLYHPDFVVGAEWAEKKLKEKNT